MTGDETPAGARVEPPGATSLKPCPFCGGGAVENRDEFGAWVECDKRVGYELACWRGPKRSTRAGAASGWNAAPRLADGLRPEPASSGFALLDEAARHALEDTAEGVLWLRRAVTTLAERHGVKLPPAPGRVRRAL